MTSHSGRSANRRKVAAWLVLMSVATLLPSLPAQAAHVAHNCFRSNVKVVYISNLWNNTLKAHAMAGFKAWQTGVDKINGGEPVVFSEGGSAPVVDVAWSWLTPNSVGLGDCNSGTVLFNAERFDEITGNVAWFQGLAAHEMGHAIGLNHVHKVDSLGSDNPALMWACSFRQPPTLKQDDHVAIQLQTDKVTEGGQEWRSATANSSFEEDAGYARFWKFVPAGVQHSGPAGAPVGTRYLLFRHPTLASAVHSSSMLLDDPTIDFVKARARLRRGAAGDVGTVGLQIQYQMYDVATPACGIPGRREGSVTWGAHASLATTCPLLAFSAWSTCTSGGWNPPGKSAGVGGVMVYVGVNNLMFTATGARANVAVDHLRVMVDY